MIPDKLRICGHDVSVRSERLPEGVWGEVDPRKLEITLDNEASSSVQLETAIHEILEFANNLFHIFDENEVICERQIQTTSTVIHQVFKENVEFTKLFLKK